MTIKQGVRALLHRAGYEIHRAKPAPVPATNRLFDQIIANEITLVFDVGANTGQFGQQMRRQGYSGKIISFEPVQSSFAQLATHAETDPHWATVNCALGSAHGTTHINISRNSWSSSIRELADGIVEVEPSVQFVANASIPVETLDGVFGKYASPHDRVLLKLDVQGFENEVLKGATESLKKCEAILAEASLSPVYRGEWLLHELMQHLLDEDFVLIDLMEAFRDRASGQLRQIDTLFWRDGSLRKTLESANAAST